MKYEFHWGPLAENQLAAIWLAARDREAVNAASRALDEQLEREPLKQVESRDSSVHRVAYHFPLGIEFEVIVDDRRVVVQGVFRMS